MSDSEIGMTSTGRFAGRAAIVVGGAGRIGGGIARRLAAEGADVHIADLAPTTERVAGGYREQGFSITGIRVDASDPAAVEELMDRVGPFDFLVNSAGLLGRVPFLDISPAVWDAMFAANVRAPFLCSQAAARRWIGSGRQGCIVTITSVEEAVAFRDQAHYAASKGASGMLTRAMAIDLAAHGIRVNAVGPGTVPIPGENARTEELLAVHPIGLGTPDDIGGAVAFLCSPDARWITGQTLFVDGGFLVHGH